MNQETYTNFPKNKPEETRRESLLSERRVLEEKINKLTSQIGKIQEEGFFRRGFDILLTVPKIQVELDRVEQKLKDVRDALERLRKALNEDD